ncbi:MAG: AI-2E family transporter [Actinobacteria bacterium]|nr:AI-2E family transporter [Actinomycetota bacterium]MBL6833118.1 AI-2E family transporter [Candidatus Actinomarina sp.]
MNMKKGESRQELLNRAFFYVLFIGIAIIIFLRVKPLIFDLFVAIVLAALAEPVVYRLSKKFGRKISALIAVFVILFVIFGIIFSLVPIMVQEIYFLSTQLPTYLDNILEYINSEGFSISNQSLDLETQFGTFIKSYGETVGETVVFAGQGVLSALGHFFIIFFFSFYLISEGEHWRESLKNSISSRYSNLIDQVWTIGVSKAGGFIVARVILGILASVVFTVSFLIIGLPSPVALGIAAGVLSQLIPVIGTFLGGIVPVLASVSLGANYVLYTLLVLSIYQLLENYFISPKITQSTMEIHPAVAVFSTIFGAYTVGAVGAILALPVAATIQGVVGTVIENNKK